MSINGFLNINKPKGFSSHDVVAKLRKILKIKKIGHAGTLDPFATGVLPIAVGSSTRLIRFLKKSKAYLAEFDLSFQTDTDDITGEKLEQKFCFLPEDFFANPEITAEKIIDPNFKWSKESFAEAVQAFARKLEQVPPLYSAVHHNGIRLYELCMIGEKVDLNEVKKRNVEVKSAKLISFDYPKATVEFQCSEGTYIRSIARDLGGHLTNLTRLESNGLDLDKAIELADLEKDNFDQVVINNQHIIGLTKLVLREEDIADMRLGRKIHIKDDVLAKLDLAALKNDENHIQCHDETGKVVGIGILVQVTNYTYIQPKVVL